LIEMPSQAVMMINWNYCANASPLQVS